MYVRHNWDYYDVAASIKQVWNTYKKCGQNELWLILWCSELKLM